MVVSDVAQELMRKRVLVPIGIQCAFVSLVVEFVTYLVIYLRSDAEFLGAFLVTSGAIVLRIVFCFLPFCFLRFVYPAKQFTKVISAIASALWFVVTTAANVVLTVRAGMFGKSLIFSALWIANGYRIMITDRHRYLYSSAFDSTLVEMENMHNQGEAIMQYVESGAAYAAFTSGETSQKQFESTMKAYNIATSEMYKLEDEIAVLRKQLEWEIKQ